jgi:hypothetical protein
MNEVEDHYIKDSPVDGCRCSWCEAARRNRIQGAVMASDSMKDREHLPSADCWCEPEVEYVPPRPESAVVVPAPQTKEAS